MNTNAVTRSARELGIRVGRMQELEDAGARPVVRAGMAAAAVLSAAFLTQQLALGRSPFGEPGDWSDAWVAIVHCLGAVYLPVAYLTLLINVRGASSSFDVAPNDIAAFPPLARPTPRWIAAGAAGLLLTALGPWLTEPDVAGPLAWWRPGTWAPEVAWHRVLGLWIGAWIGWLALALVAVSRKLSQIAMDLPDVDLFDPRALGSLVRLGVANGLTAAGLGTFIGLLGFDMGVTMMLVVFGGVAFLLVSIAVLLPMLGARARLRRERERELAWCNEAIAAARARLRADINAQDGQRQAGATDPTYADLIAYRAEVAEAETWALDTRALRRVMLYLVIPGVSWFASALVGSLAERTLLGR